MRGHLMETKRGQCVPKEGELSGRSAVPGLPPQDMEIGSEKRQFTNCLDKTCHCELMETPPA